MPSTKLPAKTSGFSCQECRYVFRTLAAAERAAFGAAGCPKCGGADIDLHEPAATPPGAAVKLEDHAEKDSR